MEWMTMTDPYEVVGQLVDGQRVDVDALRVSLADAAVRDYLIDLLTIREGVTEMAPVTALPGASTGRPPSWWMRGAVAAAVVVCAAGGFAAGRSAGRGGALPPAFEAVAPESGPGITPPVAPAPTQTIRLEDGVNWTDRLGGD
jgi:hypothetical protein